ncbi:CRISPR-associated protein Cas4 [Rhodopila sp.]|uniref:CRISPR-associated protein Cas4 n=1 Tax=Rhodopila sp. TaxID=2480087 RepID=UPI003D136B72
MIGALLIAGVSLLILALVLRARSAPRFVGELVYSDTDKQSITSPINSHTSRLTGKPDYVYESQGHATPVEVKKRRIGRFPPREWDTDQLMAYAVLLEDNGAIVRNGILEYSDRQFRLPYASNDRRRVLERAERIRQERLAETVDRSHRDAWRCQRCGFKAVCGQAL